MRESRTSGSVRGARGNPRPYRDRLNRTRKPARHDRSHALTTQKGTSWRCGNRGHFGVALTGAQSIGAICPLFLNNKLLAQTGVICEYLSKDLNGGHAQPRRLFHDACFIKQDRHPQQFDNCPGHDSNSTAILCICTSCP